MAARRRQVFTSRRTDNRIPPAVASQPLLEKVRKSAGTATSPATIRTTAIALESPSILRHSSAPTMSGPAMAIISPSSPTLKNVSLEKTSRFAWRAVNPPPVGSVWTRSMAPPSATEMPSASRTAISRRRVGPRAKNSSAIAIGSRMLCIRTVELFPTLGETSVERAASTSRATVARPATSSVSRCRSRSRADDVR